jgi:hypothetical protein
MNKILRFFGIHDYEIYREWLTQLNPIAIYKCKHCNKLKREWF